jgi:hypothetical protein
MNSNRLQAPELLDLLTSTFLGAGFGIDAAVSVRSHFYNVISSFLPHLLDRQLRSRFLLCVPPDHEEQYDHLIARATNYLNRTDCEHKVIECYSDMWCVIACKEEAVIAHERLPYDIEKPNISRLTGVQLTSVQDFFNKLWESSKHNGLLYEDFFSSSGSEIERELITVSTRYWDSLIAELVSNPREIYSLPPRKFEELVAELLLRKGMSVRLTPKVKDGGYDILALNVDSLGKRLYLVECKRYEMGKPVGVGLVRALYGVVTKEAATSGLLVTTSRFTKSALAYATDIEYRLSLKDFGDLRKWLQECLT